MNVWVEKLKNKLDEMMTKYRETETKIDEADD
jgi:hypothetical protein